MATTSIRSVTDTWNEGGTTFNAIKMDVTDSASAAASNLIDLQVGSSTKFKVGKDGAITSTSAAADAIAVGPNGATNPCFQVDGSTSSAATGIKVTGAAAAGGVAVVVTSSGTNENATIDAKGSGTLTLNGTATGAVVVGSVATVASANASALAVGPNGATNPALKVNGSVSSAATGVEVIGRAAAAGASVAVISSGTNENLTIDAKGSGTISLNATGTGNVTSPRGIVSTGTAGIGYATGAGGAVEQASSRTTGVTVNKTAGAITLVSAAGSTSPASFTVTNSTVAATDVVILSQKSGTDIYDLSVSAVAAGSFRITFNTKSGTTTEQPVINFAVIKAVAA